jgi:hypothetical protein
MLRPKFDLGKVTISTEALCALIRSGQDADFFLQKHACGDWGTCDAQANEQGLRGGLMVMSRYRTLRGKEIVVRTFLAQAETSVYCELNLSTEYHGFTYDAGPINPGSAFKYDSNFSSVPVLYDAPGLVGGTIDPGPKAVAPVNLDAFKYEALHPDCGPFGPWPPWYKTGQPEPKKPDPETPNEGKP